ncbi:RNA 2',3'-cyclic phosphodiesterase [candidate division WOR-3 bacterium]|nr:RNA 2',3'-cyclic phosphodiesterase [candidate division WOR-3 bacterium]MCK4527933.1 RNA 2',3'-cyclic phosphodiesterase [candidate division WOR-3 bacterium]
MRLFTAIEIPKESRESIRNLENLIDTNASVKWVEKENLHITLKFLGEVESSSPIEEILADVGKGVEPFYISLKNLGAFPSESNVRVLWVGVDKGSDVIKDLFRNIEDGLAQLGFQKENKNFTPHITIGRVKKGKLLFPSHIDFSYEPFLADKITLFESTLTPKGPIYTVSGRFPEVKS